MRLLVYFDITTQLWRVTSEKELDFDEPLTEGLTHNASDELIMSCVRSTFIFKIDGAAGFSST